MKIPTFDRSGYPTEETLDAIRAWPPSDTLGLMEFIASAWSYPERVHRHGDLWYLSTGGWSGNEDLMLAFKENDDVQFMMCLHQICFPGGHWVIAVGPEARKVYDNAQDAFFDVILRTEDSAADPDRKMAKLEAAGRSWEAANPEYMVAQIESGVEISIHFGPICAGTVWGTRAYLEPASPGDMPGVRLIHLYEGDKVIAVLRGKVREEGGHEGTNV